MQAELRRLATGLFPGGQEEITTAGRNISALLDNRIPHDAAAKLYASTKYLAHTAADKSKARVVAYIQRQGMGRISAEEASAIYDQFFADQVARPNAPPAAQPQPASHAPDGYTRDRAIVIRATSSVQGIDAEYQWLEAHFGKQDRDWSIEMRMNGTEGSKSYETFLIRLANGEEKDVHFDISSFYGRF
ncbi:hypothetical protein [Acidovorax sp. 69]|uniref:hypothetical protein n=1 Tax=Acidovorax sp. 69 TaxID=2035202 RepID=UPI0012FDE3E8|nr:hypothetical protein [Acidovorax sp. 69]